MPVEVDGESNQANALCYGITFAKNSSSTVVPQVCNQQGTSNVQAHLGNALDATSFTSLSIISGAPLAESTCSIACSDDQNTTNIAYLDTGFDVHRVTHDNSVAWTPVSNWTDQEVSPTPDSFGVSMVMLKNVEYIIARNSGTSSILLWTNAGGGWTNLTIDDPTDVLQMPKAKWSIYNNHKSPFYIDYMFYNNTDAALEWHQYEIPQLIMSDGTPNHIQHFPANEIVSV